MSRKRNTDLSAIDAFSVLNTIVNRPHEEIAEQSRTSLKADFKIPQDNIRDISDAISDCYDFITNTASHADLQTDSDFLDIIIELSDFLNCSVYDIAAAYGHSYIEWDAKTDVEESFLSSSRQIDIIKDLAQELRNSLRYAQGRDITTKTTIAKYLDWAVFKTQSELHSVNDGTPHSIIYDAFDRNAIEKSRALHQDRKYPPNIGIRSHAPFVNLDDYIKEAQEVLGKLRIFPSNVAHSPRNFEHHLTFMELLFDISALFRVTQTYLAGIYGEDHDKMYEHLENNRWVLPLDRMLDIASDLEQELSERIQELRGTPRIAYNTLYYWKDNHEGLKRDDYISLADFSPNT